MELLRLAFKNIFRQKTRSFITFFSIVIGAFLSVAGGSMTDGTHQYMTKGLLDMYTGEIQIHKKGYWEHKTLDYLIDGNYKKIITSIKKETSASAAPRLEFSALISNRDSTGGNIIGVDPLLEKGVSKVYKKIVKGRWLRKGYEAVIGKEMARVLGVKVGDKIVILTQDVHGVMAADLFKVVGIFDLIQSEANTYLAFIPLATAQRFLGTEGISSIVLNLPLHKVEKAQKKLEAVLGKDFEVLRWDQILPEIKEVMEFDSASGFIFLLILMIILALGVMETLLLNIHERVREIGLQMAIGMKPYKIVILYFYEGVILAFSGTLAGGLGGYALAWYMHFHPIYLKSFESLYKFWGFEPYLYFSVTSSYLWILPLILMGTFIIFLFIPLRYIVKLTPVEALRFNK